MLGLLGLRVPQSPDRNPDILSGFGYSRGQKSRTPTIVPTNCRDSSITLALNNLNRDIPRDKVSREYGSVGPEQAMRQESRHNGSIRASQRVDWVRPEDSFVSEIMKLKEQIHQNYEANSLPESARLYSEDGVDLSLIRWMLSMTPTERLQTLQQNIRSIMRLRDAKTNSGFFGNLKDSVKTKLQ